MKTTAEEHQKVGLDLMQTSQEQGKPHFALACDMGTGKTWMILADFERCAKAGLVDCLLVVTINGVHLNWILKEIPEHLEMEIETEYWRPEKTKRNQSCFDNFLRKDVKSCFSMTFDSINTVGGFAFASKLLNQKRCYIVIDESSRIKNPQAKRTKNAIKLGELAVKRVIASGTMTPNSPLDLYSQYEFLYPNENFFGCRTYRAFVSKFAKLMGSGSPLMQSLIRKNPSWTKKHPLTGKTLLDDFGNPILSQRAPQMLQKDDKGRPMFKNIDTLIDLISPVTYRVDESILNLPDKVMNNVYFDLTTKSKSLYKTISEDLRIELENNENVPLNHLTSAIKLRQVVSGFLKLGHEITDVELPENNNKLKIFKDLVEGFEGQFIVFCYFQQEIEQLKDKLNQMGKTFCEYTGSTEKALRPQIIKDFQNGEFDCFLANPYAAGVGLTLTAATNVIYYSLDYNSEIYQQSVKRAHRIGQKETVNYWHFLAKDTDDDKVLNVLGGKLEQSKTIYEGIEKRNNS